MTIENFQASFKFPGKRTDTSSSLLFKKTRAIPVETQIANIELEISKLESKLFSPSKEEADKISSLNALTQKWKNGLVQGLRDLLILINERSEKEIKMDGLLRMLGIDSEIVEFDEDNDEFN